MNAHVLQSAVEQEPCDHEWEFIDESFDHEFGTEVIYTWECQKCGLRTNRNPQPHLYD